MRGVEMGRSTISLHLGDVGAHGVEGAPRLHDLVAGRTDLPDDDGDSGEHPPLFGPTVHHPDCSERENHEPQTISVV